jgi:molybdate transport system substrate-binding protein
VFDVSGADAPRIVYPAAVTRQSRDPQAAREFLKFLLGEEGQRILSRHGFGPPPS